MIYFGAKLKQLREARKMTQQQLADKLELTKSSVSAYENSAKYPSIEVLIRIATIFDVSADYLLGLSDNMDVNISNLTDGQTQLILSLIQEFNALNNSKKKE
ncbi:MAG: helix-turn-helix domain-containing protein [Negativibacillus sp.]